MCVAHNECRHVVFLMCALGINSGRANGLPFGLHGVQLCSLHIHHGTWQCVHVYVMCGVPVHAISTCVCVIYVLCVHVGLLYV